MLFELYQQPGWMILGLLAYVVWVVIWKGLGLWHSARNRQKGWFIALLILNTVGLLPIIYLLWFKPKKIKDTGSKQITVKGKKITMKKRAGKKRKKK